jgi:hypothetical protein
MSPLRTCTRHGRPRCAACARAAADSRAAARRPGRGDRGAYRAMTAAVLEAHGDRCPYCAEAVPGAGRDGELVLAHYPLAHADGGGWTVENLRAAHRLCNLEAGR